MFVASRPSGASLRRSVWRSVVRLSAAGEGVFTDYRPTPQPLFLRNVMFFSKNRFSLEKHRVGSVKFRKGSAGRNFIAAHQ
jgi:hypothetical protein